MYSGGESSGTTPCPTEWEHLEHGADIGVRGCGPEPGRAFEQAAVALTAIVCDPRRVRGLQPVAVRCEAPELELLFYHWLNAVIYEMDTRRMLFSRFEVSLRDTGLTATLYGETLEPARHRPAVEPKGATFTALAVTRDPDGCWCAQCVIDV